MIIEREKVEKRFLTYVADYDAVNPKVQLKISHTFRVANLCEQIAKTTELNRAERDLAWLIGMLHDLGRFEQLRQYNTFDDAKSVDHARLGCRILFDEGRIREYVEDCSCDELIYNAILWHSAYRIPENVSEKQAMFAHILRDADKIDILRVNATIPLRDIYDVSQEAIDYSEITKAVKTSFYEKHATKRSLKVTPMDYVIAHCSLAFELVFPISKMIVLEQGYLIQLLDTPCKKETTQQTMLELKTFLLQELTESGTTK